MKHTNETKPTQSPEAAPEPVAAKRRSWPEELALRHKALVEQQMPPAPVLTLDDYQDLWDAQGKAVLEHNRARFVAMWPGVQLPKGKS